LAKEKGGRGPSLFAQRRRAKAFDDAGLNRGGGCDYDRLRTEDRGGYALIWEEEERREMSCGAGKENSAVARGGGRET